MSALTLVVLHGWGQSKEVWKSFADNFSNIEVVLIDLPGFGAEPLVENTWGIPEYAEWVENRLAKINSNNIILLGHSFGGRISAYIAAKGPIWLKGLILYGTPALYRPSLSTKNKIRLAKIAKYIGLSAKRFKNDELALADQSGLGKIFRNVVVFDQTQSLPKIKVPTLLLWGKNDDVVKPEIANEMQSLIPNSSLIILENIGHNAHLENPYLFYGTVKSFLESI